MLVESQAIAATAEPVQQAQQAQVTHTDHMNQDQGPYHCNLKEVLMRLKSNNNDTNDDKLFICIKLLLFWY